MNEDEARGVRAEIEESPKLSFEGFTFSDDYEIVVMVMREGTSSLLEFESRDDWNNYRGYLRLEEEEPRRAGSSAGAAR